MYPSFPSGGFHLLWNSSSSVMSFSGALISHFLQLESSLGHKHYSLYTFEIIVRGSAELGERALS